MINSIEDSFERNLNIIERKLKKIESKILSIDVDIEETRRLAHFEKKKNCDNEAVKKARSRQNDFIMK